MTERKQDLKKTWQAGESNQPELLMGVQKSHGEKPLFAADGRRVLYATATSEARDFLVCLWIVSFPKVRCLPTGAFTRHGTLKKLLESKSPKPFIGPKHLCLPNGSSTNATVHSNPVFTAVD